MEIASMVLGRFKSEVIGRSKTSNLWRQARTLIPKECDLHLPYISRFWCKRKKLSIVLRKMEMTTQNTSKIPSHAPALNIPSLLIHLYPSFAQLTFRHSSLNSKPQHSSCFPKPTSYNILMIPCSLLHPAFYVGQVVPAPSHEQVLLQYPQIPSLPYVSHAYFLSLYNEFT
jgi:hypothetical protein